jgi:hypothetical protein
MLGTITSNVFEQKKTDFHLPMINNNINSNINNNIKNNNNNNDHSNKEAENSSNILF